MFQYIQCFVPNKPSTLHKVRKYWSNFIKTLRTDHKATVHKILTFPTKSNSSEQGPNKHLTWGSTKDASNFTGLKHFLITKILHWCKWTFTYFEKKKRKWTFLERPLDKNLISKFYWLFSQENNIKCFRVNCIMIACALIKVSEIEMWAIL